LTAGRAFRTFIDRRASPKILRGTWREAARRGDLSRAGHQAVSDRRKRRRGGAFGLSSITSI